MQVPVHLDSDGQVEGMQFDLGYDQQLVTTVEVTPGGGLDPAFTVASNPVDGRLRIMIYNDLTGQQIPGGIQPVINLNLELAPDLAAGITISLELSNVVLSGGGNDITARP